MILQQFPLIMLLYLFTNTPQLAAGTKRRWGF
jgi:hypothetical protein